MKIKNISVSFHLYPPSPCTKSRQYMSKTDHEYDIVDIVTISTKFYRYQHTVTISSISLHRHKFVDINTTTMWQYRRYRYDIDTYFDDIVDIESILTRFHQHRYKQTVTISSISSRYRQSYDYIDNSTLTILSISSWKGFVDTDTTPM